MQFKEKSKQDRYRNKIEDQVKNDESLKIGPVNERWENFKRLIKTSAEEAFQKEKVAKKPWISKETLALMEERRRAKNHNRMQDFVTLKRQVKMRCREDKEEFYKTECREIEDLMSSHNEVKVFQKLKRIIRSDKIIPNGIKDRYGKTIHDKEGIIKRWTEYGRNLYGENSRPQIDYEVNSDHMQIEKWEIERSLARLKNNKASGCDDICSELLKMLENEAINSLTSLINDIYRSGELPTDFRRSLMIPLPKSSNATDCNNYRTISLISTSTKILIDIIFQRNKQKIDSYISNNQFGFRSNRGTREAILQLQILGQRAIAENKSLYVCFLDFEKAFDRVNHNKLLSILESTDTNQYVLRIIKNLYWNQEAAFKINGDISSWFSITVGVRQGCLLSPALFNIYSEKFFEDALEEIEGFKIGGTNYSNIRYADDAAIITRNRTEMQEALERLDSIGGNYNIKINVKKTKIMRFSKKKTQPNFKVNDHSLEEVDSYRYLGSLVSNDGRSIMEIKSGIAQAKQAF